jgi:hypothetical protein
LLSVSQHPPAWQAVPVVQHAAPAAPHGGTHVPLLHMSPFMHIPVFATHLPFVSQQPPLVQTEPGQHVCVLPPQFWQVPPTHVPVEHGWSGATHWLPPAVSQHAPPRHMLPAQHACSAIPQAWHMLPAQTDPPAEHCVSLAKQVPLAPAVGSQHPVPAHCGVPVQHWVFAPLVAPHAWQLPMGVPMHVSPFWQVLPLATQCFVPWSQHEPAVRHAIPTVQQALPGTPHGPASVGASFGASTGASDGESCATSDGASPASPPELSATISSGESAGASSATSSGESTVLSAALSVVVESSPLVSGIVVESFPMPVSATVESLPGCASCIPLPVSGTVESSPGDASSPVYGLSNSLKSFEHPPTKTPKPTATPPKTPHSRSDFIVSLSPRWFPARCREPHWPPTTWAAC